MSNYLPKAHWAIVRDALEHYKKCVIEPQILVSEGKFNLTHALGLSQVREEGAYVHPDRVLEMIDQLLAKKQKITKLSALKSNL